MGTLELMGARGAFVFDLFHTLVDPEHFRLPGFRRVAAVAEACGVDLDRFGAFWSATYVERETTPIDLVALVERFCETKREPLTADERASVDEILGRCQDEALRAPKPRIVELVAKLARRRPIGVLSNCHEREVRCWAESPLARHVAVFGRSCDIGAMKPDLRPYRWMAKQLGIEPGESVYVGNGSSDELAGARRAGFGYIVHCNVFDRSNGLVEPQEQLRRAGQADTTVDTVDELDNALALRCHNAPRWLGGRATRRRVDRRGNRRGRLR
ncbi:MAG: HAD family hydrolase [Acidimicrobiia bacterium]|nr:HAD family hydrolase [Acidimicrobiia bacterium]